MISEIEQECKRRGITRLCHFTPSRNLVHILTGEVGLLATKKLQDHERSVFTATDLERLDGQPDYICCSIQYPNAWYFSKARNQENIFHDWVVLLISSHYLWQKGTLFCPRNAASGYGRNISEGFGAFLGLFAPCVQGAYGKNRSRGSQHLPACPTDDQAEVLVPDRIKLDDVLAIAVQNEAQAKREITRLKYLGKSKEEFRFIVAPEFFDKHKISANIRSGVLSKETPYSTIKA